MDSRPPNRIERTARLRHRIHRAARDRYVLFNDQGELIFANLSLQGYREIDCSRILEPVTAARGRQIVWSHLAFARQRVFARNDQELVCVSLAVNG